MYPDSIFQWLGYMAVIFGVLGLVTVLAFGIESWFKNREKNDRGAIRPALAFFALTAMLVTIGCWLYVVGNVGLAQFLWVLASGTAGAGCVLWIEK